MASSAGINRETGQPLTDWDHTVQSLLAILTTRLGDRVMRRMFGSQVPGVLGQNLTPQTMMRFFTAVAIAIELWEPRFRVKKFDYPKDTNSPDLMRQGKIGITMTGEYRPRAIDGDFTVESTKTVTL